MFSYEEWKQVSYRNFLPSKGYYPSTIASSEFESSEGIRIIMHVIHTPFSV